MGNNYNLSLSGARGLLMVWIVLFHFTYRYEQIWPENFSMAIQVNGIMIALSMFFIISGFFFAKSLFAYCNSDTILGDIRQVIKLFFYRYLKLYKPYLIACLIILAFLSIFPLQGRMLENPAHILINLLFLYHPSVGYIDGAHWFISDLICINCFILMLLLVNQNIRQTIFRVLFVIVLLFGLIISFGKEYTLLNKVDAVLHFNNLTFFCVGILLYRFAIKPNLLDAILGMGGSLCVQGVESIPTIFLSILFLILALRKIEILNSFFSFRLFVWLGEISFYWYLIHQNIGYSILNMLSHYTSNGFIILVPIIITLFLAVVIRRILIWIDSLTRSRIVC